MILVNLFFVVFLDRAKQKMVIKILCDVLAPKAFMFFQMKEDEMTNDDRDN